MKTTVTQIAFRWDRQAQILWACVYTRQHGKFEVGFPVSQVRFMLDRELARVGVELPATVSGYETVDGLLTDLASVNGCSVGWDPLGVGKAVKRVVRPVTKAVRRTTRKIGRAASRAVKKYGPTALALAQTGASFVPGVGTGVAAGLGAAQALARGEGWRQALQAGAMQAIPGGALSRAAAETGIALLQGKRLDRAALAAAGNNIPGGDAGKQAFMAGLAVARGQRVDRAALAAARRAVPGGALGRQAFDTGLSIAQGQRIDRAAKRGVVRALPAVSGEALAALGAARRGAFAFKAANAAARRMGAGQALPGDVSRVRQVKRLRQQTALLSRTATRDPRARMLQSALRSIF